MVSLRHSQALRRDRHGSCGFSEREAAPGQDVGNVGKRVLDGAKQLHPEQAHPPWAARSGELWTWTGPHHQAAGIRNPQPWLTGDPSVWPPERALRQE